VLLRFSRLISAEVVAGIIVLCVLGVFLHSSAVSEVAEDRSIVLSGLAGSVRSGAALAHSIWMSEGARSDRIALGDGQTVDIDMLTGYPEADIDGLNSMVPNLEGFDLVQEGRTVIFSLAGIPAANCHVTYSVGGLNGEPPTVSVKNNANGGDCG